MPIYKKNDKYRSTSTSEYYVFDVFGDVFGPHHVGWWLRRELAFIACLL